METMSIINMPKCYRHHLHFLATKLIKLRGKISRFHQHLLYYFDDYQFTLSGYFKDMVNYFQGGLHTMRILVDADACPKKEEIIQAAQLHQIPVLLVSSISHFSTKELPEGIERIWVDKGSDQADFKIMKLAYPNDIVVTQDYGLASMLLPKRCRVLHHEGYEYTNNSIQKLIDGRHLSAQSRRQSKKSKAKSLNPFADETQYKFDELLEKVINEQLEYIERDDQ